MQRVHNKFVADLMGLGAITMMVMGLLSISFSSPAGQLTRYHVPASGATLSSVSATTLPGDGSGTANPPGYVPPAVVAVAALDNNTVLALGRQMNAARFGDAQWPALYQIWMHESGWNPSARNGSSGACGIPQALPCSKIVDKSVQGQVAWGLSYIAARYGSPQNAWIFWQAHRYY